MENLGDDSGAIYEAVVFLSYFKELPDARQAGKIKYPLDEILAVMAGSETVTDIAVWPTETASPETLAAVRGRYARARSLGDILATLDAEAFERCFVAWVAAQTGIPAGVVALDGKTARRSGSKTSKKKKDLAGPIHVVSAFAARQRLVLGQVKVEEKSNEIVAIPKLLRMLEIKGAGRDRRRHGLSARHRADDPRQEGRLHPRPEGQSGLAQRRRQTLCR